MCLAACRQSQQPLPTPDDVITIDIQTSPQPAVVGDLTLVIQVFDKKGSPIPDAHVDVRGDMTHAGMEPVLAIAQGSIDNEYRIPFRWTMAGDWVVTVNVVLSSGETFQKTFNFTVTSP